jgi:SAM-dependent methyltransferase
MEIIKLDNIYCPICGSTDIKKKLDKYDDRYACPGMFEICVCKNCGHLFITLEKNMDIGKLYTEFYPRKDCSFNYQRPLFNNRKRFKKWLNGENGSAFLYVPEKVKVLDIGCGVCDSLLYHQSRGCDATGIEADENVRFLKEKLNVNLMIGEFKKELFENESFDFVTMDQVIEHFEKPLEKLEEINKILVQNGKIVLTTPNASGWGVKIFGKYWINWHSPYHLNLFTKKSIKTALERSGFKNIEIKTVTSSEWIRYQWIHLLFYPKYGQASVFWCNEKFKWSLMRFLFNVLYRAKIYHIITRFFDVLGIGDNMIITAEKK